MIKRLLSLSGVLASNAFCHLVSVNATHHIGSELGATPIYDSIAKDYQAAKKLLIGEALDDYNIFHYLGNIEGKHILDLACGDGYYARQFLVLGAEKAMGVDISPKMIELAEQQQQGDHKVSYRVSDVCDLNEDIGQFDIVTGIFLLHYSESPEKLERMFEVAFRALKPGGTFLMLNNNMRQGEQNSSKGYYHKYNIEKVYRDPICEGSICDVKLFNEDGSIVSFSTYHYSFETYQNAAKKAGFDVLEVLPLFIAPEAIKLKGVEYWQDYMNKPSNLMLRTYKPV